MFKAQNNLTPDVYCLFAHEVRDGIFYRLRMLYGPSYPLYITLLSQRAPIPKVVQDSDLFVVECDAINTAKPTVRVLAGKPSFPTAGDVLLSFLR